MKKTAVEQRDRADERRDAIDDPFAAHPKRWTAVRNNRRH